jgi:hypothetical protein
MSSSTSSVICCSYLDTENVRLSSVAPSRVKLFQCGSCNFNARLSGYHLQGAAIKVARDPFA